MNEEAMEIVSHLIPFKWWGTEERYEVTVMIDPSAVTLVEVYGCGVSVYIQGRARPLERWYADENGIWPAGLTPADAMHETLQDLGVGQ